nr:helix-turn-helix transcriptional regulator [Dechloromonas sp.]
MVIRQTQPLAALLQQRMEYENVSVTNLARRLGVAQSYLSELLRGDKSFQRLDEERLRAVANYLHVPAVIALLLVGRLRHTDFVEPAIDVDTQLSLAMAAIAQSPVGLETAVSQQMLDLLPREVKLLLALIYQSAGGERFLKEKRWDWTLPGRDLRETI